MKRFIGLLGWVGVLLVVASVVIKFTKPEWPFQTLALAGLVIVLIYAGAHWREFSGSFSGRSAQYGSIAAGSVLAVLAILVAVNYIANRQNHRWDLTTSKEFTISDQSKQLLATLKAPLTIRVFYSKQNDSEQSHRDRLENYEYLSKQVSIDYIDAVSNPARADQDKITAVPTLIFEYGGRTQRTNSDDESSVANALKKVIEGEAKKAYFTQGHGEHELDDDTQNGYSFIAGRIKDDNIEVAPLQIAQRGSIPADCAVLVIAGPTTEFMPEETKLISAYLEKGGKVLLALDPPMPDDKTPPVSLVSLAKAWGVQLGDDVILDQQGLRGLQNPIGLPLKHPINAQVRYAAAFLLARSATPIEGGSNGHVAQSVLQTGQASWAESNLTDLYKTGKAERNLDKGDKPGPVSLASAVSAPVSGGDSAGPARESRFVVFGDSDFGANVAVQNRGNMDLFLNTMNWLAQQENLIAIRPKDPEDRRLQLSTDEVDVIFYLTVLVIPLAFFGNAFRVYWKRR